MGDKISRKSAREIAVQLIYSSEFSTFDITDFSESRFAELAEECDIYQGTIDDVQRNYIESILNLYQENHESIDACISKYAKGWSISRLSSTARAVLRCAVCEIMYMDDIPDGVAIDSAVEIAKGYDDEDTVAYINGVLGGIVRGERND